MQGQEEWNSTCGPNWETRLNEKNNIGSHAK